MGGNSSSGHFFFFVAQSPLKPVPQNADGCSCGRASHHNRIDDPIDAHLPLEPDRPLDRHPQRAADRQYGRRFEKEARSAYVLNPADSTTDGRPALSHSESRIESDRVAWTPAALEGIRHYVPKTSGMISIGLHCRGVDVPANEFPI
jgi:hypothetical protein